MQFHAARNQAMQFCAARNQTNQWRHRNETVTACWKVPELIKFWAQSSTFLKICKKLTDIVRSKVIITNERKFQKQHLAVFLN